MPESALASGLYRSSLTVIAKLTAFRQELKDMAEISTGSAQVNMTLTGCT